MSDFKMPYLLRYKYCVFKTRTLGFVDVDSTVILVSPLAGLTIFND